MKINKRNLNNMVPGNRETTTTFRPLSLSLLESIRTPNHNVSTSRQNGRGPEDGVRMIVQLERPGVDSSQSEMVGRFPPYA